MPKVLCMEVGTELVRVAEVNKMPNKVEILRTHSFSMPDDATKDGKVRLSDGVIGAIRDGLDESGIKAEDVYFAVDSTKILFSANEICAYIFARKACCGQVGYISLDATLLR